MHSTQQPNVMHIFKETTKSRSITGKLSDWLLNTFEDSLLSFKEEHHDMQRKCSLFIVRNTISGNKKWNVGYRVFVLKVLRQVLMLYLSGRMLA